MCSLVTGVQTCARPSDHRAVALQMAKYRVPTAAIKYRRSSDVARELERRSIESLSKRTHIGAGKVRTCAVLDVYVVHLGRRFLQFHIEMRRNGTGKKSLVTFRARVEEIDRRQI